MCAAIALQSYKNPKETSLNNDGMRPGENFIPKFDLLPSSEEAAQNLSFMMVQQEQAWKGMEPGAM